MLTAVIIKMVAIFVVVTDDDIHNNENSDSDNRHDNDHDTDDSHVNDSLDTDCDQNNAAFPVCCLYLSVVRVRFILGVRTRSVAAICDGASL